jgi:hypothetical protein
MLFVLYYRYICNSRVGFVFVLGISVTGLHVEILDGCVLAVFSLKFILISEVSLHTVCRRRGHVIPLELHQSSHTHTHTHTHTP